jgi:glycosyltransferase involved in cell wall biosynthesis
MPNQFWTHKNHRGLLEALCILRERGIAPHVVLTGGRHDYRDPGHFERIMRQIEEWRLSDHVHYLGMVGREDVYDLIRECICVVNPSLFEGWGYAVDEAAAIGKRILASDIAAHRDQAAPACDFFDPTNAEQLANKLADVWQTAQPGPDVRLEAEARQRMPSRVESLGNVLFTVLADAIADHERQ